MRRERVSQVSLRNSARNKLTAHVFRIRIGVLQRRYRTLRTGVSKDEINRITVSIGVIIARNMRTNRVSFKAEMEEKAGLPSTRQFNVTVNVCSNSFEKV